MMRVIPTERPLLSDHSKRVIPTERPLDNFAQRGDIARTYNVAQQCQLLGLITSAQQWGGAAFAHGPPKCPPILSYVKI